MRVTDLLTESFPYPPGSTMPAGIVDLRDPIAAKGRYRWLRKELLHHLHDPNAKPHRYWSREPTTVLVLTKTGGLLVFYYGDHNIISWKDVLQTSAQEMDTTLQSDRYDITVLRTGYLIDRSRTTGGWGGDRNTYSRDIAAIARALLERGAASPSTPIWVGSWAAKQGEHIGTVGRIIAQADQPKRLVLYHGTDTMRLEQIQKVGLRPLPINDRVWNRGGLEKTRPEHRDAAVYLTASRPQAEYYANKAVRIDRARNNGPKRAAMRSLIARTRSRVAQMTAALDRFQTMSPEQIEAEDRHSQKYDYRALTIADQQRFYPEEIAKGQALLDQMQASGLADFYGKIEPVILQVTLSAREFNRLRADDDHLAQNPTDTTENWHNSLSHFGQIAYVGTIPPERLKVVAQGKAAAQVSR